MTERMTVSLKAELKLDEEEMTTGPDGQAKPMQIHEIMDIKRDFLCLSQELLHVCIRSVSGNRATNALPLEPSKAIRAVP